MTYIREYKSIIEIIFANKSNNFKEILKLDPKDLLLDFKSINKNCSNSLIICR